MKRFFFIAIVNYAVWARETYCYMHNKNTQNIAMPCIPVDTNMHNIIIQHENQAIEQRDTKKHAKRHCVSRDTSWAPGHYTVSKGADSENERNRECWYVFTLKQQVHVVLVKCYSSLALHFEIERDYVGILNYTHMVAPCTFLCHKQYVGCFLIN